MLVSLYGATVTSLNDDRLSFLAMNFFRCSTVAWAEQRIHLRLRPRSLLLLHSRQMLTCEREHTRLGGPRRGRPEASDGGYRRGC